MLIGVYFTEQVVVAAEGGLPTVELEVGDGVREAQYIGEGEEPALLIFGYTVQAGDRNDDGEIWVLANSLTVPAGSSITDRAGNHADTSWLVSSGVQFRIDGGPAILEEGTFISVSAGWWHSCGLKADGSVVCWGNNEDAGGNFTGQATPPDGAFASVSAGGVHTCGLKANGSIECWGWNKYEQATPPAGSFTSVSAGGLHTCGVKTDGSVECWGSNDDGEGNVTGQATPPAGSFASVSAGGIHTCGLKTDGSVECWGSNDDGEGNVTGQATPPSGSFASVSAGGIHTCGLKTDGSVECWGSNDDGEGNVTGQATPPSGSFASVSAGGIHTCGVKTDGSVVCWGSNDDGETTPPSGSFASVSAGGAHTCGIKADGSVECWGWNEYEQATPPGSLPIAGAGDDDHANTAEGATAAAIGEAVQGELEYEGDVDYFVFHAEEGKLYQIDVALGTLSDSLVDLYDAQERSLAFNDDHGSSFASRIVWVAPNSGEYYAVVGGYDTGSYTLTVTVSTPTPVPTPIPAEEYGGFSGECGEASLERGYDFDKIFSDEEAMACLRKLLDA